MEHLPDDSHNQVLVYESRNGTVKPEIFQPAALPDSDRVISMIVGELQDAAGLHAISQGDAPGRVDSFKALELLRNEDQTRLQWLNATMDATIADGFYQLLQLARQYVPGEIIATTYTRRGTPEVQRFKARDRISERHTVRVIAAAAVPKTQALRRQRLDVRGRHHPGDEREHPARAGHCGHRQRVGRP